MLLSALYSTLFILLLPSTLANTVNRLRHVVHEKREVSPGWTKTNRLHPKTVVPVRIALSGQNSDLGHELLMDV